MESFVSFDGMFTRVCCKEMHWERLQNAKEQASGIFNVFSGLYYVGYPLVVNVAVNAETYETEVHLRGAEVVTLAPEGRTLETRLEWVGNWLHDTYMASVKPSFGSAPEA